jgi:hypothetical protein
MESIKINGEGPWKLKTNDIHINRLLGIFTLTRLVVSTAFRMVYPFLPALARGLGMPIEAVAAASRLCWWQWGC